MAAKVKIKVNPKTRAVEKRVDLPKVEPDPLPNPEPIRLSSDVKKVEGNGPAQPMSVALAPPPGIRLDLACGQSPREGFEGVDFFAPNAKHKVDLLKFPWPWADNSVDEINCSHFVEHIPDREVSLWDTSKPCPCAKKCHGLYGPHQRDSCVDCTGFHPHAGQDMLFAFFDECYRILKHESTMTVACPSVRSERAFQDPTHRRFIAQATFFYLSADWRKQNKLDHYNVRCNFSGNVNFSFPIEYQNRHDQVRSELFAHAWNVILDWTVALKVIK
jgi:predicted SAM-dependent methyltransferase